MATMDDFKEAGVKLIILAVIGLICFAVCQSELPHVALEILRILGEVAEHVRF